MLRVATESEKQARDVATWPAWGSGLTLEQFRERERRLRTHRWARDTMTTWLWLEGDALLASCETFRLPSRVAGVAGHSWSIASVFVEPHLRGHGHASRLMSALVARLSTEPRAQAAVLFSEVGAGIYAKAGFFEAPAWDVCFAPARGGDDAVEASHGGPVVLCADPPPPPEPVDATETLVVTATADEVDWHLERERCYAEALGRPPLAHHGATLEGSSICWAAYHRTRELHVLALDVVEPSHRAPLIRAAQKAAWDAQLSEVRVWETTPLADLPGARRVRRDEALPMFAPLVPALSAWTQVHRALWV